MLIISPANNFVYMMFRCDGAGVGIFMIGFIALSI
jgi:hypothetical protein